MSAAKKKVAFHTLGCKLNFTETSTMARSLDNESFEKVSFDEKADIYIINTCTVTDSADKKSRQAIKKAIKQSSDAFIIVAGCYAQLKPVEIASIPGVDLVLGTDERFNLKSYIEKVENHTIEKIHSCETPDNTHFSPSYSFGDRTRSFLKVQDGCDYVCSYCTIPLARGKSRNQQVSACVSEAKEISSHGIKEIVITGVNIGDFGKTSGESFFDLLKELVKVDGIERYRISSIEPNLLTDDIIDLVLNEKKLLPHFHIPLQSGSDQVLTRMKRRYPREVFAKRIDYIRKNIPYAGIGADVIVGFPGESDEEFKDTLNFLKEMDISYLHVFSFSPRANTSASGMTGQVTKETIKRRSKILHKLSEVKRIEFRRKCVGLKTDVLWEKSIKDGFISGFTENYLRVITPYNKSLTGKISEVLLLKTDENGNFEFQKNKI